MIAESEWAAMLYNRNEHQKSCNCNEQKSWVTKMKIEAL